MKFGHFYASSYIVIFSSAHVENKDVPISWSAAHLMQISLVSAPSLDSSWSVVWHTKDAPKCLTYVHLRPQEL
jgi:hypothetical protein